MSEIFAAALEKAERQPVNHISSTNIKEITDPKEIQSFFRVGSKWHSIDLRFLTCWTFLAKKKIQKLISSFSCPKNSEICRFIKNNFLCLSNMR